MAWFIYKLVAMSDIEQRDRFEERAPGDDEEGRDSEEVAADKSPPGAGFQVALEGVGLAGILKKDGYD